MFKGLAGLGSMMKQAQQISGQMQGMAEELKSKKATGSAGAGMVEVEINGAMELLGIKIEDQLLQNPDRELIEDLVVTAVNQAIGKARQLHAEAMQSMTGGMNIPGLQDALSKMTGDGELGDIEDIIESIDLGEDDSVSDNNSTDDPK